MADNAIAVLPSEKAQYSAIIDKILANSDLNTISARRIRGDLETELGVDLSEKKVGRISPNDNRRIISCVENHLLI